MSILFVLFVRASSASLLSFDLRNHHFGVFFLNSYYLSSVFFSKNIFQFLSKLNNIMAHLLFLTLILNWLMEIKTGATTSKT